MSVYLHFTDTKSLLEIIEYTDAWAACQGAGGNRNNLLHFIDFSLSMFLDERD